MQISDMKPDDCALVNVLSACAGVGGLSQGSGFMLTSIRTKLRIMEFHDCRAKHPWFSRAGIGGFW